jgi:hypothetical protein
MCAEIPILRSTLLFSAAWTLLVLVNQCCWCVANVGRLVQRNVVLRNKDGRVEICDESRSREAATMVFL